MMERAAATAHNAPPTATAAHVASTPSSRGDAPMPTSSTAAGSSSSSFSTSGNSSTSGSTGTSGVGGGGGGLGGFGRRAIAFLGPLLLATLAAAKKGPLYVQTGDPELWTNAGRGGRGFITSSSLTFIPAER